MGSDTISKWNLRKIIVHYFDVGKKREFVINIVNRFHLVSDKVICKEVMKSNQLLAQHPDLKHNWKWLLVQYWCWKPKKGYPGKITSAKYTIPYLYNSGDSELDKVYDLLYEDEAVLLHEIAFMTLKELYNEREYGTRLTA